MKTVRFGARVGDMDFLENCKRIEVDTRQKVDNLMEDMMDELNEEIEYEIFEYKGY